MIFKLKYTNNFHHDVPEEVWSDLAYEIGRNQLERADNYRAYRFEDLFLYEEYLEAEKKGCCGFFHTHTFYNGQKWIIACNYGH